MDTLLSPPDSVSAPSNGKGTMITAQLVADLKHQSSGSLDAVERLAALFEGDQAAYLETAAAHFRMRIVGYDAMRSMEPDFDLVPFVEAGRRLCAAFREADGGLLLATADPLDARNRSWIDARLRGRPAQQVSWGLTGIAELRSYLSAMEKSVRAMDTVGLSEAGAANGSKALSISIEDISSTESLIVRLVNSTIYDALRAGASDIHLETHANGLNIKYRIDGVLGTVKQADGNDTASQVLSRIKVLSELDIAERRIPQDGRFKVLAEGREIDLRVSIMPNLFGEDAVLRVLDRHHLAGELQSLSLDTLGFSDAAMHFVRRRRQGQHSQEQRGQTAQ